MESHSEVKVVMESHSNKWRLGNKVILTSEGSQTKVILTSSHGKSF